jgi:hypothetical protein
MYNLFDNTNATAILNRLEQLKPDIQRKWGRMDVTKMMAHCSAALEMSMTQEKFPRSFMGFVFGKMARPTFSGPQPFKQNLPTDKRFLIANPETFEIEKAKLISLVKKFSGEKEKALSPFPHPFFGKLRPEEWAAGMHKHLDHHLQQFGV